MSSSAVAKSLAGSGVKGSPSESPLAAGPDASGNGSEGSRLERLLFQIEPGESRDEILRQAKASFGAIPGCEVVGTAFLRDGVALAEPPGTASRLVSPAYPAAPTRAGSNGETGTDLALLGALWFQRLVVLTPGVADGALPAEDGVAFRPASAALPSEADLVLPIGGRGAFLLSMGQPLTSRDVRLFLLSGRHLSLCLQGTRWRRRLESAQEEARRAKQIRSSVLRNLNHEVRTPLTSVIGFAEAIAQGAEELGVPKADLFRQQASLIEKEGRRLLGVLNQMIRLSKIESQSFALPPTCLHLGEKAREVSEDYRAEAEKKGLEFRVDATGPPAKAQADPKGLEIVLESLLSNAIKFTPEGSVVVRVRPEPNATPPSSVIAIEDTGIGVVPERTGRIFEPFRQESEGLERKYEGLGLGLAVARRVTEQMEGEISVSTQKGSGSTFLVRLPAPTQTGRGQAGRGQTGRGQTGST